MATLTLVVKSVNRTQNDFSSIKRDIEAISDEATKMKDGVSSSFSKMASNSKNSVNGMQEIVIGAFRQIGTVGVNALISIGNSAKNAAIEVVEVGKAFDSTMSGVEAILSPTVDEMKALNAEALALGSTTVSSTTEVASAIEMLGKNGLTASEILGGALKSSLNLAATTSADLTTSADITTDSMQLFKLAASETGKAVNGISGVVVNSKFDINDYALALAQAGGVASLAGVDFDDFNTTIAGISPSFASGSDAGTSFKVFLQRLVPTTADATTEMANLGLITEDGSNKFFDASGNLRSMSEVSGLLQTALKDLSEEQKTATLTTIFGTDALRAAAGMANLGSAEFDTLAASIASVDADQQASVRLNNLEGDTRLLDSASEGLSIRLYTAVNPALRELTQSATNSITKINTFIDAFNSAADKAKFLQTELYTLVQTTKDNLIASSPQIAESFRSWGTAALAWVTQAAVEIPEKLRNYLANTTNWIEENKTIIGDRFKAWAENSSNWIVGMTPGVTTAFDTEMSKWLEFLAANVPKWGSWFNAISDYMINEGVPLIVDTLAQVIENSFIETVQNQTARKALEELGAWFIRTILTEIETTIKEMATGMIFEPLELVFKDIDADTLGSDLARNIVDGFAQGIGANAWRAKDSISDTLGSSLADQIREEWGMQSPSKVALAMGRNIGDSMSTGAEDATYTMDIPKMTNNIQQNVEGSNRQEYHLHLQTANTAERENLSSNFNTLAALGNI